MVIDVNKKMTIEEYKKNTENNGKVALFDTSDSILLAEGDGNTDWVELELRYEKLRETGKYELVVMPLPKAQIQSFNWRRIV